MPQLPYYSHQALAYRRVPPLVYKIDLPQGTPITQAQAQKVQVGMTPNQVLYVLGSPAMRDTLAPNRWDYIYDYTPGTYGTREA